MDSNRRDQRGFVLIGMLLVMVMVMGASALMLRQAEFEQQQAAHFIRYMRARTAAEAGVDRVLSQVAAGQAVRGRITASGNLGDVYASTFEAVAQPLPEGVTLPGWNIPSASTTFLIESVGRTTYLGEDSIQQRVITVVDNRQAVPRVLLWAIETPSE